MTTKIEFSYTHKNGKAIKQIEESKLFQGSRSIEMLDSRNNVEVTVGINESVDNNLNPVTHIRIVKNDTQSSTDEVRLSAGETYELQSEQHKLKVTRLPF